MKEKIEKLIDELLEACEENKITLVLAAFDETKEGRVEQTGEDNDVKLAILGIFDEVENKPCDCVMCRASISAEEAGNLAERSLALAIAEILAGAIG
ncbi:hypothetical protein AL523_12970 [Enterococcus gallinarum]|uniref:hypothetical protein n=1 Tax=Enterococcus casseliflavus TaxID=37734 RepID=UPI00076B1B4F|nr:hypothetical protein [Enterococcus casseliflavus]AMG50595.1 hypothetical protein AL523_12970 [Enterococcus gallinarum]GEB28467.1 hypothetical protein ECA02_15620 [Enterococcus casseliflavus]STP35126.1 Uncharacterised protein [Enterococcus casseliflavus]